MFRHISEFTPLALAERLSAPLPETRKLLAAWHRQGALPKAVQGVTRVTMDAARTLPVAPELEVVAREASQIDPFVKYAFRTHDGHAVEAVRIPLEKPCRFVVCVSSQVGCALTCTFCATGRMGLKRNLETWEIIAQVRHVRADLPPDSRIHGVVFQGMGEPLANYDRVLRALQVLSDPCGLSVDARNITVTTSGLATGIFRLMHDAPNVRLGWSIGSAITETRKSLMPITKAHSIADVFESVVAHAMHTRLAPLFAYTPLAGVNDSEEHARALGDLVRAFQERTGQRPRVSLIPYNSIGASDPYARQSDEAEDMFRGHLRDHAVYTKKRYSGGGDVAAACGQLAGATTVEGA